MPYENFPYADLHNLNLDWLLRTVKEMKETLDQTNIPQLVSDKIDAMVEDGTMDEIINQEVLGEISDGLEDVQFDVVNLKNAGATATVAMLGKSASDTNDPDRGYSLCLVIYNADFCVVYDMGNDDAAKLLAFLSSKGITQIDAMIISHYHSDHCTLTGVNNILASGKTVKRWYLPHGNINWDSFTGTTYEGLESAVKAAITAAGQTYTNPLVDGETAYIASQARIQFYNLETAFYADYYSYLYNEDMTLTANTNYNNFSMCCRVTVGGQMLALTGDIEMPAQANMTDMIKGADILQIPHHGLNLNDSQDFRNAMSGQIFLTAAYGISRERRLKVVSNLMLHHARELGCSISNIDGKDVICTMGGEGCHVNVAYPGVVTPVGYFGDVLRPGADLDDLVEIGREYFIQNASDASGIDNIPESGAGKILILSTNQNSNDTTGSIMQYYEASFSYAHPKIFIRWKYEGTWTSWMQYEATSI